MTQHRLALRQRMTTALAGVVPLLLCAGTPSPIEAQPANASANAPASTHPKGDRSSTRIEEVVVTAQRTRQSLQRVPVTVTALAGAQLRTWKINTIYQLAVAVPSLAEGESNYFSIRGVGTLAISSLLDQSVGVSLDDVSLGVPGFMSYGLVDDISQIEVLSGPQGLLFGRNASAGLINVNSNKPVLGSYGGEAYFEFDDRDSLRQSSYGFPARATVNIPVTTTSALRINLNEFYQDPITDLVGPVHGKNYTHDQRFGIRVKYLWQPSDEFSAYLIGDYSEQKLNPYELAYRDVDSPSDPVAIASAADGIAIGPDNFKYGADGGDYRNIRTGGVSLHLTYEVTPRVTLSNIAAWRAFNDTENADFDYTSANLGDTYYNHYQYNQYSDELRLALKPGGFIDGQAGFYTFIQRQEARELILGAVGTDVPNLVGSDIHFVRDGQSYAGYGQVNLHPWDKFTFIIGGRVSQDYISLNSLQNAGSYGVTLFGPKDTLTLAADSTTNFTYRIGSQYQFTRNIMGYITYTTGYKAPSYNQNVLAGPTPGSTTNPLVKAETVSSIEGGLKTTLLDQRLRLNVSAFDERFHNLQVQYLNPYGDFVIGNADSARTEGVEVSANARPMEGLSINAGLTAQSAKFLNYAGAPCYPGQGCATFNAKDINLPNAARFTSTIQVMYEMPVSERITAFIQGDYYYRSPINFLVNAEPRTKEGNTDTLGLSAGFRVKKNLEISIFCRNCGDQHVPEAIYDGEIDPIFGHYGNTQQWGYESVRTIGASATYRF